MHKVVLITGAARGIGAATAQRLAAQGYAVAINYRSQTARALALCEEITASGGVALPFKADISVEAEVQALFEAVTAQLGTVTHLVNNAGILATQCQFAELDLVRWERIFATNVTGTFLCCREAIKTMPAGGAIVNVSSAASYTGAPFEYVDYAASKGAVDSLTKGLAMELAARQIRVNAVRPGCIETEIHADGGEPNRVARVGQLLPLQRGGTAAEVAAAITWLLSDEASYVTGNFIDLAGGR
ncbi:SDR family oxidoreductase [Pseudoalteromonas fenneropenaei]|uniref:SDR family oxidoreductase n=1 Tax=Pseudoalteromonas fenneropenaei TaxID=1737459 RepID=A0ABV7CI61_9GAMM